MTPESIARAIREAEANIADLRAAKGEGYWAIVQLIGTAQAASAFVPVTVSEALVHAIGFAGVVLKVDLEAAHTDAIALGETTMRVLTGRSPE